MKIKNSADFTYDGKNFPFEDETFDSAVCSEVLEHVFEPNQFLKEVNRVLKKKWIDYFNPSFFGMSMNSHMIMQGILLLD